MSHIPLRDIHAYKNRGLDIRIDVDTDLTPGDFSAITFRIMAPASSEAELEVTGLSASAGGSGALIDLTLTATQTDSLTKGPHIWEMLATVAAEPRTLATGWFHLDSEPTGAAP